MIDFWLVLVFALVIGIYVGWAVDFIVISVGIWMER